LHRRVRGIHGDEQEDRVVVVLGEDRAVVVADLAEAVATVDVVVVAEANECAQSLTKR
jgi:hypothetical protein